MARLHAILTPAAILALLLLPPACALRKPAPAPPQGSLSRIVDSGEIRVGTSGDQPPLSMTAKNGELLGLDVALARVLARSMGVKAKFVQRPFGQLLAALEKGEVDIVMSGVTITPKRIQRVAFVGPYYTSGKSILTRSPELAAIEVPEQLDSRDLRLAALAGSTSEDFVRESLPKARLVTVERLEQGFRKLLEGDVAALVADRESCDYGVLRHPDAGLIAPATTFTVEPMGIAVRKDEPRLANLIETYLTALERRGALEKAKNFWFGDPSWVSQLR